MKINPSKTINELILAISYAADIEGEKRIFHAWRVALIAARICGFRAIQAKQVFYAGILHDIGGVGFPFHIIHYLKKDDEASQNILLSHPIVGAQLVSNVPRLDQTARLIIDHHEWINGHGYPRAKTKKDIPPGAQIIRICDSIDVLLQSEAVNDLKALRKIISSRIDKEYPKKLCSRALNVLKKGGFFDKIYARENIPALIRETNAKVGLIRIPEKIDAIGIALQTVAEISDMKHPYTYGHSMRVSRYALAIALAMRLEHDEVTRIKWAGLMHDIGKISVTRKILDKPSGLTKEEYHKIQEHAYLTEEIMGMIPSLKDVIPLAAGHHEYFDGSGYPQGLKGKEIPLGARIVTICDAFDAMTSNRPYRDALPLKKTCLEIKKLSGKQFDPEVVKIALPLLKNM